MNFIHYIFATILGHMGDIFSNVINQCITLMVDPDPSRMKALNWS